MQCPYHTSSLGVLLQKLISNLQGKHKVNQYNDGDSIPDKTY